MKKLLLSVWMVPAVFGLVGCEEKQMTYLYLMQHPQYIQAELDTCKEKAKLKPKAKIQDEYCATVENAARSFRSYLYQYQSSPEKFGMQIMVLESDVVNLKERIKLDETYLKTLRASASSAADIKKAEAALDATRFQYRAKQNELSVLLTVVGLNGPE